MKRLTALFLTVLLVLLCACGTKDGVFIRVDRDDPEAWKGELANVRYLTEEGMSGSAQFSETQFRELAAQLREKAEAVWIVDCRLESHGLINGMAVSWCDANNAANAGKSAEEKRPAQRQHQALRGDMGDRAGSGGERGIPVSASGMPGSLLASRRGDR